MTVNARAEPADGVTASGFFVLRTPLLPFSELEAWSEGLEAVGCVSELEHLEPALARDRQRVRERLRAIVDRPEMREALLIASSTISEAIDAWREAPESDRGRTTEEALVAYFSRAAGRATPFGLFAGSTTGSIAATTCLSLPPRQEYRRQSRLDMEYLSALADAVERDPVLRRDLVYRPNSSLYEIGGRFHFAERRQTHAGRSYDLVAVEKTPYLAATLERAEHGARLDILAAALVDDDVTYAEADEYLGELVDSQILTADLGPQLTGSAATDALIERLAATAATAPLAGALRDSRSQLAAIDEDGVGASPARYRQVASALAELPHAPGELSRLVQVDLAKPGANVTLGRTVVREIVRGVHALHALAPSPAADALSRFRDDFVRRYETRQVPLVEALDEEHGIGFDRLGSGGEETPPLLAGLPLQLHQRTDGISRWTQRDALLLRKLTDALSSGSQEIALDEAELSAMQSDQPPLPDAFEVIAALEAASSAAVDEGRFRLFLQAASGPPGAKLLGRFCHLDPELDQCVHAHVRAEEGGGPGVVFAEIVHQPEGRVGNILSRPVLRSYEIPYLGESGAAPDRQIPVSDLLVSLEGEAIVLWSRRFGCQVVPRLTTAHNHSRRSLRIYRFLCALQHQGVTSGLMWHWGPLETARFLPRVALGRTILSRARWNLDHDELAPFRESRGAKGFAGVQALRAERNLPRWVALADADNELVVDLDNISSVEALARQVRGRGGASLVEVFPAPDGLCAEGPEGKFTSQLVVPFLRQGTERLASPNRQREQVARRFPPGSEWLYVKFFAGPATTDIVLDRVAHAIAPFLASGTADRWFFIRYSDPDWHLRLRVHGVPERLVAHVLPAVSASVAPLVAAGRVWRTQVDTYEREVERYGGDRAIALAEDIFHLDSDAVLAIVRTLDPAVPDLRWRAAFLGIDMLFDDFELTLEEKREIATRGCRGYGREFGAGKPFQRTIGRRYRDERALAESMLAKNTPTEFTAVADALRRRSERIRPVATELRQLAAGGELTQTISELAMSHAHMHVNRLLRSSQRAQELVLYEFLSRAYSSLAARR